MAKSSTKASHIKTFNEGEYLDESRIEKSNIAEINTENMKLYGANINIARVFPDVADGLKSVERRILYSMYAITKATKRMSKVATITGDVMKIHAHGDASVYGTLVRIAQPWNMVIPYIKGQGGFGNISGSEASAARYIEAMLSEYTLDCFFSDYDPKVVLMQETYNRDLKEPVYLPSKYPNCLLSSADGLGFGPATHVPTFNLEEVLQATIALIKDHKYEPLIIPDITTGCLIVDEGKFAEICQTGRGTFKMRAEIIKDEQRHCIIIKSIPFQVSLLSFKEKFVELVENKVITGFKQLKDYCSETKIHCEIYFRPEVDLDNIISILYTKTRLEETYPVQMKMVDNFAVEDFNVKSALLRWYDIRFQFKRKLFINRLVKLSERCHILKVLIMILDGKNGEKTLKIIKSSTREEIIKKLVKEYNITSLQATEISNMRLSAFSKTALQEYKEELTDNEKEIKKINKIVKSRKDIDDLIIKELEEGIKKYSMPRKSRVIKMTKTYKYSDYDVRLIFTKNGYVKKIKDTVKNIGKLGELDEPVEVISVNNRDEVVIFDKRGSVHTLEVGAIAPDDLNTIGTPLSTYVNINGSPVSVINKLNISPTTNFIFVTKNGIVKKTSADNFAFKNSIIGITLKSDDALVSVIALNKDIDIITYSKAGYGLRFNTKEIPSSKRMAIGVIAFPQLPGDEIVGVREINKKDTHLFIITDRGFVKKCALDVLGAKKRRTSPVSLIPLKKDAVNTMINCNDDNTIVVVTKKDPYTIAVSNLPESLKYQEGTKLIPVKQGDAIINAFILTQKEE